MEFEDKLNTILSDQETMGKLMALAQSLEGSSASNEELSHSPDTQEERSIKDIIPALLSPSQSSPDGLGGIDPTIITKLLAVMKDFGQEGEDRKHCSDYMYWLYTLLTVLQHLNNHLHHP